MKIRERIINAVIAAAFKIACKLDVQGVESIPDSGPAILITNHTSLFEGPLYYVMLRPRRTIALAKIELWDHFATRIIMEAWGSIPVKRKGMDMKAIRDCFNVLDEGHFLCIAPEGTRSKTGALKEAMPGTTFFATRQGVPIYPMVQWGLRELPANLKRLKRTSVHIRFGEPFTVEKPGGGKLSAADREVMANEMMYRLADLLPEEFRGHYSDNSKRSEIYIKSFPREPQV
jgi:1-acyl-sn-glycerol-3-phosphate acyltransferase